MSCSSSKVTPSAGGIITLEDCCINFPRGAVGNNEEVSLSVTDDFPLTTKPYLIPVAPVIKLTPNIDVMLPVTLKVATWCKSGDLYLYSRYRKSTDWKKVALVKSENYLVTFEIAELAQFCVFADVANEKTLFAIESCLFFHNDGKLVNIFIPKSLYMRNMKIADMKSREYVHAGCDNFTLEVQLWDTLEVQLSRDEYDGADFKNKQGLMITEDFLKLIKPFNQDSLLPPSLRGDVTFSHTIEQFRNGMEVERISHNDRITIPEKALTEDHHQPQNCGYIVGASITTAYIGTQYIQGVPEDEAAAIPQLPPSSTGIAEPEPLVEECLEPGCGSDDELDNVEDCRGGHADPDEDLFSPSETAVDEEVAHSQGGLQARLKKLDEEKREEDEYCAKHQELCMQLEKLQRDRRYQKRKIDIEREMGRRLDQASQVSSTRSRSGAANMSVHETKVSTTAADSSPALDPYGGPSIRRDEQSNLTLGPHSSQSKQHSSCSSSKSGTSGKFSEGRYADDRRVFCNQIYYNEHGHIVSLVYIDNDASMHEWHEKISEKEYTEMIPLPHKILMKYGEQITISLKTDGTICTIEPTSHKIKMVDVEKSTYVQRFFVMNPCPANIPQAFVNMSYHIDAGGGLEMPFRPSWPADKGLNCLCFITNETLEIAPAHIP